MSSTPWRNPKQVSNFTLLATSWFALGLIVVLLLGVALVGVLTFWGPWLEENWSLSFPSPLPMIYWYFFPLIPLAILLLYFLKLKRKALQVPSTFLWRKSIEDLHVNSLFQWLRRNFLLVLQLLCLLGLGYALAGPTYNSEARGRHVIIMLDNSASMGATDETPTRLEAAKKEALERINALDSTDQAMIISFNDDASIVQSYTNKKEDLRRALDRVEPTQRSTQIDQALALAEGQANPRQTGADFTLEQPAIGDALRRAADKPDGIPTQVFVYTDGRFPDLPDFSPGKLDLRLRLVGRTGNNVGITRMQLRRHEDQPDVYELSIQVLNFGRKPISDGLMVQMEVFGPGGRLDRKLDEVFLKAKEVAELPAVGDARPKIQETPGMRVNAARVAQPLLTFTLRDPGNGYVRVSLIDKGTGGPWEDDLAVDNVAWLAMSPVRRARILRIGPRNDILDAILKAATNQQRAVVDALPVEGFAADALYRAAQSSERYDLVLFDRCAPATMLDMPQANTFFIGQVPPLPPRGAKLWEEMPVMQDLYVKEFLHSHALLRGVDTMQGMSIFEARALPPDVLPTRASALFETQREPVLWALGRARYTDLVMTFPLVTGNNVWNTNWPRQPAGAFPLFFDNVVTQLGRFKEYEDSVRPGQPKIIDPGAAVQRVTVTRRDPPGGVPHQLAFEPGKELAFGDTGSVGLYDVAWGDEPPHRFAVNLFDAQESNVEPREAIQFGEEHVEQSQDQIKQRRELWPWFVLAGLAILLVEWIVYQRRIYV